MTFVFVISREPKICSSVCDYLRVRGYVAESAPHYDAAMEVLNAGISPEAFIVDVQGVPRGEAGATFQQFGQFLANRYRGVTPPGAIYLLRKGTRRPNFRIDGPVVKKPLSIELLGQTVRELFGPPGSRAAASKLRLDRAANTLFSPTGEARLTNIEANLLAYLMDHGGEILHPRELLVDVWEYHDAAGASTLVRAHVSNLRRKLRAVAGNMEHIQTIRGKGYRFIA